MKNPSKLLIGSLIASSLGLISCDKQLDINTNPNLPESVSPDLVLPAGTVNLAYVLGGQFQIAGGFWAGYWTQNLVQNQYKDLDKYTINPTTYDTPFQTLFAGAQQDFQTVINKAKGDSSNYAAIAGLEQAFTYQVLSDAYDRVPFGEALQGENNLQPRYDEGAAIYDGIIRLIDASVARINTNPDGKVNVGRQDVIFGGDMDKWRRFANTLKLRVYLRQIYARPTVATAGIRALYAAEARFLAGNEDAQVAIFNSGTKQGSPLFLTEVNQGSGIKENIIASSTVIDYLQATTNDPRINALFDRPNNAATGSYVGTRQGAAGVPGAPATALSLKSRPDLANIIGPSAPVILISGAESLFLQAEAAERGLATGLPTKTLYEQGITASWNRLGVATSATVTTGTPPMSTTVPVLANFLASAPINLDAAPTGDGAGSKLDRIITQKWVSMCGTQSFEAWTELRRTNFPSIYQFSASSSLLPGVMGNRFQYPATETQRNPNTPALVLTQVPVWWDVKPL